MTSFTGIRIVIILHFKRLKTILGIVHTLHLIQLLTLIEDELFCLWMVPSQQVIILSGQTRSKVVWQYIKGHLKHNTDLNC